MRHGKKTQLSTLKIISEYAEKIILYMKENKSLKTQLNDLKITLSINKEMLNTQIKNLSTNPEAKNQIAQILASLQNENIQITNRNMKLYDENLNLEKQLYKSQQDLNEKIESYENKIKELNDQNFIFSNQIIQKENEIKVYKKELSKLNKDEYNQEIYIYTTPDQFNLELNNELYEAREIIKKYSHLFNDAKKVINELNVKIMILKEIIDDIKKGKRIKKNLENIANFGYILTEDSNESQDNFKSFYEDDNDNFIDQLGKDDDNNFCCDSPLVQFPNKIKQKRYLTTTTSINNEILVPKLDLSTIIKKYKPIDRKDFEKKENLNFPSIHNILDDRDYIDKLNFKLKYYKNILKKYKQKLREQKQINSMLKKQCMKYFINLNTPNCSTSDSKIKIFTNSNETKYNLLNESSMDNNINCSIESEINENELNIIINEVNKEAIGMLGESNSFYNK